LGREVVEREAEREAEELRQEVADLRVRLAKAEGREQQFLQSQKLEAVGQLAGGIAHDFNNLLTAINGYCELLELRMRATDPLREWVGEIRKAGSQAAALTTQLLAFSRKQRLQIQAVDFPALIDELSQLLRRTLGERVKLEIEVPAVGTQHILADPNQIRQVIVNLAVNARDAMDGQGTLRIASRRVQRDDFRGKWIELEVSDTGCGMDAGTRAQIFEPFFTTKPPGKGTGLGLSTVYGIVKQSGGDIEVQTEIGVGTSFRLYFAETKAGRHATNTAGDLFEELESGWETVMVVEDEAVVRELAESYLTFLGYQVLVATNGAEAFELCLKHGGPIHLVLSDVVMPEMSGPDLALRLSPILPDLKWIFMSGYTRDTDPAAILGRRVPFVQKPFQPMELGRLIRSVLDT
jgi:two-component system cell cycle sensor histidine kinase/response regulator CckA